MALVALSFKYQLTLVCLGAVIDFGHILLLETLEVESSK